MKLLSLVELTRMDQKTKVIVQEIEYWKKNKLLPVHYCEFLLTLYTEGSKNKTSYLKNKLSYFLFGLSVLLAIGIIGIIGYYFNHFSRQLQIALLFFVIFLAGIFFRWFFIQILGLFCLISLVAWTLVPIFNEQFSWVLLEGSWSIAAILFLLIAWLTREFNFKLSMTFYLHALLLLFVPFIQGLFITEASVDLLQLFFFTKLIILALVLWITRNMIDYYVHSVTKHF